ncbi:hypothetical protein CFT12S02847_09105, partial [Campylobacter fetus subsp. testudinum]
GDTTDTVTTVLNAATTDVTLGTGTSSLDGVSNQVKDIIKVDTTASSKKVITINGFDTTNDKINFSAGVTDKGGLTTATAVSGVADSDNGGNIKIKVAETTDLISFFKNDGIAADNTFVAT